MPACTESLSNNVKLDGGAINLAHFYREIGLPCEQLFLENLKLKAYDCGQDSS